MKNFLLFLFCFASSVVLAAPPLEIQLGEVGYKGSKDTSFVLHAKTNPLFISKIESSCRCTKLEWSKKPVAVGDSLVIRLSYRGDDLGVFYKVLKLHSSDTAVPSRVILRGVVR